MAEMFEIPGVGELTVHGDTAAVAYRVLLLDDDDQWAKSTEEVLRAKGVGKVDRSRSVADADAQIQRERYDAVIADVLLQEVGPDHKGSDPTQGDEWLLRNKERLDTSYKVALTAYPGSIRDEGALRQEGIRVISKSEDEELDFYDELGERAQEKKRRIIDSVSELLKRMLAEGQVEGSSPSEERPLLTKESGVGERVAAEAANTFLEWVDSRGSKEQKSIWIGQERYSLEDLASEVEKGSELGERLLSMFLRHMRLRMGLGNPLSMKPQSEH